MLKSKVSSTLPSGYMMPEMDSTPYLNDEDANYYQQHLNNASSSVDLIRAYVRTDLLVVGKLMSLGCFVLTAWLGRLSSLRAHSMSSWTILYPFWD